MVDVCEAVVRLKQWKHKSLVQIRWHLWMAHYVISALGQMRRLPYLGERREPCTKHRVRRMGGRWALMMDISDDTFKIGLNVRVR